MCGSWAISGDFCLEKKKPISDLSAGTPTFPLLNSAWTEPQPQCLGFPQCRPVLNRHHTSGGATWVFRDQREIYPPAHIHALGRDSAPTASAGESSSLWEDLAMLCAVTFPCSAAMQHGTKGTSPPPPNVFLWPKAAASEHPQPMDTPVLWRGSLHILGLSHVSRLGDGVSQEHMFPRKPGLCLSQRAHPTISLSAVKVRNSFGYLAGFRRLGKEKKGKEPLEDRGTSSVSYK